MLFSNMLKSKDRGINIFSYTLTVLCCFCLCSFFVECEAKKSEDSIGWHIISKNRLAYRKIQKAIVDIKEKTGKNISSVYVQDLIDKFNLAVNKDVDKVINNLSEIIDGKDMRIVDRMLKKIIKRTFITYIPSILTDASNGVEIDVDELSHKIVSEAVKNLILRG